MRESTVSSAMSCMRRALSCCILVEIRKAERRWHSCTRPRLKEPLRRRVGRLHDCVVNQAVAIDAACFSTGRTASSSTWGNVLRHSGQVIIPFTVHQIGPTHIGSHCAEAHFCSILLTFLTDREGEREGWPGRTRPKPGHSVMQNHVEQ